MQTCATCGKEARIAPVRVRWPVRLALLGLTFLVAYLVVAPLAIGMLEGVRDGFAPAAPSAVVVLVLAAAAFVAGFLRLSRPVCTSCREVRPGWLFEPVGAPAPAGTGPDRRGFLAAAGAVGASGVAAIAAGAGGFVAGQRRWLPVADGIFFADVQKTAPTVRPEWKGSAVRSYRRLGRTDARVSDISLGSGQIKDKRIAIDAIDRGVNYFDTAPDYSHYTSEKILGEAIRETGGRDRMFLASKFCTAEGHLPTDTPVPEIMAAVEGSLSRLGTDYLDLVHIHSCDDPDRLMAPNFHEAFDRLREQGKARFLGVSTHTPDLVPVARQAIASDRFDVMMLAYHYGLFPEVGQVIDEAHAKDVGIVAMKTLKGGKAANLVGFQEEAGSYAQAAFRWVLSNPSVSCLVVSFSEPTHCDEYLFASGQEVRPTDQALLDRYDRLASADYCRPHCGACLDSCERDLPIDQVLRYDMYFESYPGRKEMAREKYAKLSRVGLDASACEACPAPCAGACPFELPIRPKMVRAHERLKGVRFDTGVKAPGQVRFAGSKALRRAGLAAVAALVLAGALGGCAATAPESPEPTGDDDLRCVVGVHPEMNMVTFASPAGLEGGVTSFFFARMPGVAAGDLVRVTGVTQPGGPKVVRVEAAARACTEMEKAAADHHKHH